MSASEAQRRRLAAHPDSPPEVLMLLAGDAASPVREAVAGNAAAPAHADRLLAQDRKADIRAHLARKLGAIAPELMADDLPRRRRLARDALLLLAQDVEAAVRAALADTLADLSDAPRELVISLARDAVLEVCEPLLRLSAALNDQDLLEMVARPPHGHTRPAIARRLQVATPVAQALLDTREEVAVVALLRNCTARVEPSALARLVEHAPALPWLQEPLAVHPRLPPEAASRLVAGFTRDVLAQLRARTDLPGGLMRALGSSPGSAMIWGA